MPTLNARRTVLAALALGALITVPSACTYNRVEGNMRSDDHFTYVSTYDMPITVTLSDLRDGSVIWTFDVPVGRKLSLRFHPGAARGESLEHPDLMRWGEFDKDSWTGAMANSIPVPPATARRLDVRIRDTAELTQAAPAAR